MERGVVIDDDVRPSTSRGEAPPPRGHRWGAPSRLAKARPRATRGHAAPLNLFGREGLRGPHLHEQSPRFRLPAVGGGGVDLDEVLRSSAALLVFHHGAWCGVCHQLLTDLAEVVRNRRARTGTWEVLAISDDVTTRVRALLERLDRAFPLLADKDNAVATAFELLDGRFSIWMDGQRVDMTAAVVLVERDGSVAWARPVHEGPITVQQILSGLSCRRAS